MTVSAAADAAQRRRTRSGRRRFAYQVDVALHLVRMELATRHRGSIFGWLWALGPPVFQLAATYFLFSRVIPLGVEDYPVFLLVGILAWGWFASSLGSATVSLESRRDLVLRPGFSTELLPITAVLVALVDYLIALPVLFVALGFTVGLQPEAVILPVLLLIQLLYTLGFALAVAPLQVFLRDTRQFVVLLVSVGFWLTPIFYRRSQVPDSLAWLYDVNPMAHLIVAQRCVLLGGELPPAGPMIVVALAGLVVLVAGYAVFVRSRHAVPEHL